MELKIWGKNVRSRRMFAQPNRKVLIPIVYQLGLFLKLN